MTANDFYLLFIAFGGFVIAPAFLLWVFSRVTRGKQDPKRDMDIRPDVEGPDSANGGGRQDDRRPRGNGRDVRQSPFSREHRSLLPRHACGGAPLMLASS